VKDFAENLQMGMQNYQNIRYKQKKPWLTRL